jgi:D-tyrosyl-tRNA(Tyr) deacylase
MRAVVQRVDGASVAVVTESGTETVGGITGEGLCVLVGVTHEDTAEKAAQLARKLWSIRILEGEKSCSEVNAPLLVISQFTLYGDARKGRRPTWNAAAPGPVAEPLVAEVVARLRDLGAQVETGRFGAEMRVSLTNHGPFTVVLDL